MSSTGTSDASTPPSRPGSDGPDGAPEGALTEPEAELTEQEQIRLEQAAEEVAAVRARLAAAPAELVVTNHVMGLYELAAIHLDRPDPQLEDARLAIDALGAVLDACVGRLGEPEATLVAAREQIQLAFVVVAQRAAEAGPPAQEG